MVLSGSLTSTICLSSSMAPLTRVDSLRKTLGTATPREFLNYLPRTVVDRIQSKNATHCRSDLLRIFRMFYTHQVGFLAWPESNHCRHVFTSFTVVHSVTTYAASISAWRAVSAIGHGAGACRPTHTPTSWRHRRPCPTPRRPRRKNSRVPMRLAALS